jgi:hypothetical protein
LSPLQTPKTARNAGHSKLMRMGASLSPEPRALRRRGAGKMLEIS